LVATAPYIVKISSKLVLIFGYSRFLVGSSLVASVLFEGLQEVVEFKVIVALFDEVIASFLGLLSGSDKVGSQILFKALKVHDLLLNGAAEDETVHVDSAGLAQPVSSVHGLQVSHRIPVMFQENDNISTSKSEAETTNRSSHDHDSVRGVLVERVY